MIRNPWKNLRNISDKFWKFHRKVSKPPAAFISEWFKTKKISEKTKTAGNLGYTYLLEIFPINRFREEILQINSRVRENFFLKAKVPVLG
jgi:hypothetical protein